MPISIDQRSDHNSQGAAYEREWFDMDSNSAILVIVMRASLLVKVLS